MNQDQKIDELFARIKASSELLCHRRNAEAMTWALLAVFAFVLAYLHGGYVESNREWHNNKIERGPR
jgi:hypothetical protein